MPGDTHPKKIMGNFLLANTDIPQQGKFDTIPRNTLKHNAEKVLEIIKNLS